jgi:class 3 adenylate cyclase/tetratricopeptide (TPR) repeat protein
MHAIGEGIFCFEGYTLDLRRGCLRGEHDEVELRPKSFEVLRYLVENAGRLVSKDELIQAVWPNVIVTDESLTRCVSDVRRALQDDAQRIIKTVPRRGYLLAASVSHPAPDAGSGQGDAAALPAVAPAARILDSARSSVAPRNERMGDHPQPGEARLEERRQLTVMACELIGLAALSAQLDPEDLREVMAACHRRCAAIIERHRGYVARYSADGLLAYFGYPDAHEHDAENAVRAGLALVGSATQVGAGLDPPLQLRIGIASGIVLIGEEFAAGAVKERTAVGETPTLSGRLQALAEPGRIVISHGTRRLAGGLFDYHDLGRVALAGMAAPVQLWQVLGASLAVSRFEAEHPAGLTPLVGREEEIELLLRRWKQAQGGEGSVVLVAGEPGIGKSRIAQTVLDRLGGEKYTRLRLFCSPHHQDTALYPSITQLERAADFRHEDSGEERLEKLEALLARARRDLGDAVPLLAELLSVPTGDRYPSLALTPPQRKERTLKALVAQVEGLAASRPVLLVAEDAHWADPTSLELFDLLVERVASLPLLAIVTYRPEFAPPWVGRPQTTLLTLSRLSPRQRVQMIAGVIDGKTLPKAVADEIVERTDGVPLFIEELTKAVVESGAMAEEGDRYTVRGALPALAIPMTLHASLLARLDRLAPAREVAQLGAALGRQFSHQLISAVAAMPQQQLDEALARLVGAELIYRRGAPPDAEYIFKHALVQDAAYDTLPRSRRQHLHARIAATLEDQFPEIVAAQPALLAHHCTEALLLEAAIDYWLEAGTQAVARSAMVEAIARLERGLELIARLPDSPRRRRSELDLRVALGKALIATKGYAVDSTGATFDRARELCEQLDRPPHLLTVLHGQWTHALLRSELTSARQRAEELLDFGERNDDAIMTLMGCRFSGITHFSLAEFGTAQDHLERGLRLFDPAQRPNYAEVTFADGRVVMAYYLSWALTYQGDLNRARHWRDEALADARRLAQPYTLAHALCGAGFAHLAVHSWGPALALLDELIALSTEHAIALFRALGTMFRGSVLAQIGHAREGVETFTHGSALHRETGSALYEPTFHIMLADIYGKAGLPQAGLEQLAEAARLVETTHARNDWAELYRVEGDLLAAAGNVAAAETSYRRALSIAREQNAKLWELRAAMGLARLWRRESQPMKAKTLLGPIHAAFADGSDAPILAEAKTLLDELG